MENALEGLKRARDQQATIAAQAAATSAREHAKLKQFDEMISRMTDEVLVVDSVHDLVGLGITAAAERVLREHGTRMKTGDIADEIQRRGVQTTSERWTPTVYSSLYKSKRFHREGEGRNATWDLSGR